MIIFMMKKKIAIEHNSVHAHFSIILFLTETKLNGIPFINFSDIIIISTQFNETNQNTE